MAEQLIICKKIAGNGPTRKCKSPIVRVWGPQWHRRNGNRDRRQKKLRGSKKRDDSSLLQIGGHYKAASVKGTKASKEKSARLRRIIRRQASGNNLYGIKHRWLSMAARKKEEGHVKVGRWTPKGARKGARPVVERWERNLVSNKTKGEGRVSEANTDQKENEHRRTLIAQITGCWKTQKEGESQNDGFFERADSFFRDAREGGGPNRKGEEQAAAAKGKGMERRTKKGGWAIVSSITRRQKQM